LPQDNLGTNPVTLLFVPHTSQLIKIPLPGEKAEDIALLVKWLTRDTSYNSLAHLVNLVHSFGITAENFFSLARLADKFIIPHLSSLLTYYSHTLLTTSKPSYDLWLAAARHEMYLVEKTCRNAARLEVSRILAEKGISYFIVGQGISPTAMDGIIMDLMKLKDNYIANRQVRGGIPLTVN
jgi:hypothetical protein